MTAWLGTTQQTDLVDASHDHACLGSRRWCVSRNKTLADTDHVRRHQLFVHMVRQQRGSSDRQGSRVEAQLQQAPSSELLRSDSGRVLGRKPTRPAELPVYSKGAKIGYS